MLNIKENCVVSLIGGTNFLTSLIDMYSQSSSLSSFESYHHFVENILHITPKQILAGDMGLGKTPQVLAFILSKKNRKLP